MSKYRVVIRAFTLRRDAASAILMARLLERQGCQVVIASGRNFLRSIRYWNPDAIIVNTASQINRCAEMAPGAAVVLWPGEGAQAMESSTPKAMTKMPGSYDKMSLALLWGRITEGFFHELFPGADHSKLVVCGNPRLDMAKYNTELPGIISGAAKIGNVGFIGRYHVLNRYNAIPAIFSLQYAHKREGVVWQVENFICMMSIIHRLLQETNLTISIRPHPMEAPEGYDFVNEGPFAGRIEIDDSLDVAAWSARQRVIIAPSSQSFYESYVLGVPVISMDRLTDNAELIRRLTPHASMSQLVSHNPHNLDDVISFVGSGVSAYTENAEIDKHLDEYHDWFSPHSALQRGAAAIMSMLHGHRRPSGLRLPTTLLESWDRLSFARAYWREPLHPNFNFHRPFHRPPAYFDRVLDNIVANRSILTPETLQNHAT